MSVPAEHEDPAQAPSIQETALTPSRPFMPDSGVGWTASDWLGKTVIDRDGQRIGKLHGIYVDVETDEPQFGTVKEGIFGRHLTFVSMAGVTVSPSELCVSVLKEDVRSAPNLELRGEELSAGGRIRALPPLPDELHAHRQRKRPAPCPSLTRAPSPNRASCHQAAEGNHHEHEPRSGQGQAQGGSGRPH
jgi:hypothetical protein